jgi:hypothetical protein
MRSTSRLIRLSFSLEGATGPAIEVTKQTTLQCEKKKRLSIRKDDDNINTYLVINMMRTEPDKLKDR